MRKIECIYDSTSEIQLERELAQLRKQHELLQTSEQLWKKKYAQLTKHYPMIKQTPNMSTTRNRLISELYKIYSTGVFEQSNYDVSHIVKT